MHTSHNSTAEPQPDSSSRAFAIVPFSSIEDAEHWVSQLQVFEESGPVLVTAGAEREWVDPSRGVAGTELTFEGGWRAKFAGSGTVVLARCEEAAVPGTRMPR